MDYTKFSDIKFIEKGINELGIITESNRPYTRLVFSDEFYAGRDWLSSQFQMLGIQKSIDEAGNLIGIYTVSYTHLTLPTKA